LPPQRSPVLSERRPGHGQLPARQREAHAARRDPADQLQHGPRPLLTPAIQAPFLSWVGRHPAPSRKDPQMSAKIEGHAEQLLKGKNFAHVGTLRSDGSVLIAPTWVDAQDGMAVVNTAEGRVWPRNLERDPRVTLEVQNMENPYEYV